MKLKYAAAALFLAVAVISCPAMLDRTPTLAGAKAGQPRSVRVEGDVNAPVSEVWRVFTTSEGAMEFFAEKANIQLALGGPYEIQFDPKDERSGTKGLKILSFAPDEMISFQWNAPPEMPEVRNGGTWVVVQMRPEGPDRTHVTISHLGWKEGEQWDQAYLHFIEGWSELINRLRQRFTSGPIDWNKQHMMYQKTTSVER
jgi:uncharacterized protein YndB with AHSA1/START domain